MSKVKMYLFVMVIILFFFVLIHNYHEQRQRFNVNEIIFWHGLEGQHNNELLTRLVNRFNDRHPEFDVILQNFGAADQVSAKLMTAVAGNTQPDIIWWAPQQFGELARAGVLMPLDELIEGDDSFDPEDIYSGLWDSSRIDGSLYAVPFATNCLAMYYNKDMFEEAGLSIPETWDEMYEAAKLLSRDTNNTGRNDVFGFQVPLGTNEWTVWTWQTLLWQAGGTFYNADTNRAEFGSEKGAEALSFWNRLKENDYANFSESGAGYALTDFLSGRIAMMINGPWNFNTLLEQDNVNFGAFPLPGYRRRATNIGGESLAFFAKSEEKKYRMWQFARYIMSPEFQVEWAMNTGYLPVSISASESPEYTEFLEANPFIRVFVDSMNFGFSRPSIPEYNRISSILGIEIEKALYGIISEEEALRTAQDKVNQGVLQ